MDTHGHHPIAALLLWLLSASCTVIGILTIRDAQVLLGMIASAIAIVSGICAAMYYREAWKEKKISNSKK